MQRPSKFWAEQDNFSPFFFLHSALETIEEKKHLL